MDINNIFSKKDRRKIKNILQPLSLDEKRKLIEQARGKQRQELFIILDEGESLCQELPNEEFFYTVKEIGDEDATAMLVYASNEQLQFLLDMELWSDDLINIDKAFKWLTLIVESDIDRAIRFFSEMESCLLFGVFQYLFCVHTPPDGMDVMEARNVMPPFTLDDIYYIDFICPESTQKTIVQLLKYMFSYERNLYRAIMENLPYQLESDLVENSYQSRIKRLEYDGIPTLEEALSIYAPLSKHEREKKWKLAELKSSVKPPHYPMVLEETECFFRTAFQKLGESEQNRVQLELAAISNKIMVADKLDSCDLDNLKYSLMKAIGISNIALQAISKGDIDLAAKMMGSNVPLHYMFRLGDEEIKKQAARSRKVMSVFKSGERAFAIEMLGHPYREIVKGLQSKYPLFYVSDETVKGWKQSERFKNFWEINELRSVKKHLSYVESVVFLFTKVFSLWKNQIENILEKCIYPSHKAELDYSVLLMTLICNVILNEKENFKPIPKDKVFDALEHVWENKKKIHNDFMSFLCNRFVIPNKYERYLKTYSGKAILKICEQKTSKKDFKLRYFHGICVSK